MKNNSLFKLIHLFGRPSTAAIVNVDPTIHCEQNSHHDFYCDAEKPYINKSNNNNSPE